jgi:DNA repair protein RecN (Recombination protein N)
VLLELRVENLLLIEQARLRFAAGLNVLTGETGAGKTVLAHALDLLLGGRARAGIVRPGAGEAYVEGSFELPHSLLDELGERLPADATEIVLARRVGADGRTRAYLNGRSTTVGDLRDLGASLLSFYGQHEHRRLTIAAAQLELLDETCGPGHAERLHACAAAYHETVRLHAQLDGLRELSGARERELELLDFELAEIAEAALEEHEHEELLAARECLRQAGALCAAAGAGVEALASESAETPGAAQRLASAAAQLDALAGVDGRLDGLGQRLRELVIESRELAGELRDYAEGQAADPPGREQAGLDAIEERLVVIERLLRKHGGSVQAVMDHADRARARRDELADAGVKLEHVVERLSEARASLDEHVRTLRRARESAAPRLARAVRGHLRSLAMGDAAFEVVLARREVGPRGGDAAEFMISPNPGVPAGPVREIASGGELSRVMLALMSAASASASTADGTLVFDEVDAGIGGQTARAVGARLRELARGRQVLCITHLPQIASLGERHFAIFKDTSAEPTRATVVELERADVVAELVRMLGADGDDGGALRHARALLRAA